MEEFHSLLLTLAQLRSIAVMRHLSLEEQGEELVRKMVHGQELNQHAKVSKVPI